MSEPELLIDRPMSPAALRYATHITIGEGDAAEHCEIVSLEPLRVRRGDVVYEVREERLT